MISSDWTLLFHRIIQNMNIKLVTSEFVKQFCKWGGGGGGMGSRCAFGYSSALFIQYQLLMSFIL